MIRGKAIKAIVATVAVMTMANAAHAEKMDYSKHRVLVDWDARALVDGHGTDALPAAALQWTVPGMPSAEKPAVAILDYETPVRVSAIAHYFYVPGSRDQRYGDWLSGPSACDKVKLYTSDDKNAWKLVSDIQGGLPTASPQVFKIDDPTLARYLKIEIISLTPSAGRLRSYELVTYTDEVPTNLPNSDHVTPVRSGYPNKKALVKCANTGTFSLGYDNASFAIGMAAGKKAAPVASKLEVRVSNTPVVWQWTDQARGRAEGTVNGNKLDMSLSFVQAGLLLDIEWKGPVTPPYQKIDVVATPDFAIKEWCVPGYELLTQAPGGEVAFSSAIVQTRVAAVSDGKQALAIVPDSDRSWIGFRAPGVVASFAATREKVGAILLASSGDWYSGYQKAVEDIFDFHEPRQFSPMCEALTDICSKMLMSPEYWCEKYDVLYSTPPNEVFYIFYDLPYNISALMVWERLSDDPEASRKIDKTIKFALDQRIKDGPMAGSMFNMYYNQKQAYEGKIRTWDNYQRWKDKYKTDDEFIGMDQGSNHWITSHTPGGVLWTIAQVWMARGSISDEMLAGAKDIADWLVRTQREDGSWPYAFNVEGTVAFEETDSGTIWNVWALHRFAKLTGEAKYKTAADKARAYFKKTFTDNHLYRGYWEDNLAEHNGEIPKALNNRQGYESSVATMAYIEMGDKESAWSSARDATKFVCTRQLESRDYWTSYGGVSEQQWWAPSFYLCCPFGYAIQQAWRMTGDDFLGRFAFSPKYIGWSQQSNGASAWVQETVGQYPIEEFQGASGRGLLCFWTGWVSAQEVAFGMPWLVDELNRRSGDKIAIDLESLAGKDDRGVEIAVKVFNGKVNSASNQINWLGMKSPKSGEYQLALINHAEATTVTIKSPFKTAPSSARMFTAGGKPKSAKAPAQAAGKIELKIPTDSTMVLVWAEQ